MKVDDILSCPLEELKIFSSSKMKEALVEFVKTAKAAKEDLEKFIRFKLLTPAKKLTLKGLALAVGMNIDSNSEVKLSDIKKFVADKNKPKVNKFCTIVADRHGINALA